MVEEAAATQNKPAPELHGALYILGTDTGEDDSDEDDGSADGLLD